MNSNLSQKVNTNSTMSGNAKIDKLVSEFKENLQKNLNQSVGIAVIRILTKAIAETTSTTFMGVDQEIRQLISAIENSCPNLPLHFKGAAQVFVAGMSKASESRSGDWVNQFIIRANECLSEAEQVLNLIPDVSSEFLQHGMVILTRGFDPMVANALNMAASDGRQFHVVITEGRPQDDSARLAQSLDHPNLKITIIPDSAVGVWINKAHAVLIGTDLVLEDGSLIAPVGTYTMCVLANVHRKPVYCACETFKFMRSFVLSQSDMQKYQRKLEYQPTGPKVNNAQPVEYDADEFDYTPAKFVTLLLTEKGPMPPSAVTHGLTKLLGVS